MTEHDQPDLDDVLATAEQATPDHHEHGKTGKHPSDDALERRTHQERIDAGLEDYDRNEVPAADA